MTAERAPAICSVGCALPANYAGQETLIAALRETWGGAHYNVGRLEQLHRAVQVEGRYLALPLSEYGRLRSFEARNRAWCQVATELGDAAVRSALRRAGLEPTDVDLLFFVSTTGIATPSIDARIANRLELRPDVRRSPLFGLGCAGGTAAVGRAADVLRAEPAAVAVVVAVELCSLTLQADDLSVANLIASGLFGDGAAAVVLIGAQRAGEYPEAVPRVAANASVLYRDSERVMGWDVVDSGFKIVLSASVPDVVRAHVGSDVDAFLADQGLGRRDIRHWLAHTGGPRVLEAFEEALDIPGGALERSWSSLRKTGNLSSASVLFVLRELLEAGEAAPGDLGLMMSMGPGFGSELALLRW